MGIFGRKRKAGRARDEEYGDDAAYEAYDADTGEDPEDDGPDAPAGPYDVADAPDDGRPRMDLGSVRVPVPDGSQVQVEMDQQSGNVRAVHIVTGHGQVTVSAYAAPRSGGLWKDVSAELADQLRADGAKVTSGRGEWGTELSAIVGEVALRFVGVDGPRWMLRGVIAGPQSQAAQAPVVLRDIVRETVVVRGDSPMPVRTPLPIKLPESIAAHIAEQQAQQG
ncbi:DUF3710 domain-containing protein [Prauserella sp. PE36]|uniref:DUF3710 domain-containing protein n=1 Tax=Prauserella sp. PE36 TaxID=1504709 RepID=UPI000D934793|nr:DUF3710 domain-containing protein [Prauserella sp. PE36]PXY32958.1 hypothetical protein BAY59_07490 [Prauserella coralliicola]RBM19648.1 DUF3710 domain-containing protein [Prauserella sp. PE36]